MISFLIPRPPCVTVQSVTPHDFILDPSLKNASLELHIVLGISNPNFYDITIKSFDLTITYNGTVAYGTNGVPLDDFGSAAAGGGGLLGGSSSTSTGGTGSTDVPPFGYNEVVSGVISTVSKETASVFKKQTYSSSDNTLDFEVGIVISEPKILLALPNDYKNHYMTLILDGPVAVELGGQVIEITLENIVVQVPIN
jgi:hypothetical protein